MRSIDRGPNRAPCRNLPAVPGLLLVGSLSLIASLGVAQDKRSAGDVRRSGLELFADPWAVLDGNEFLCWIRNSGDICAEVGTSPFGTGGFWPETPNAYVFDSGLQIAGVVGTDGGPWAGDTTGAFFYDPRGTQHSTTPLTDVFVSADAEDLAEWPVEARLADDDLFRPSDVGRAAISESDSWVRYWDGDPSRSSGRPHPAGLLVTQRSLQWRYPSGNESVIYFLAEVENVTGGEDFQRLNEAAYFAGEDVLADEGYTLTNVYAAFTADMDVSDANQNFSTAILPFDLSISYHGGFDAPAYEYSPQIFYPPFFTQAPGIVGIKYLRTPEGPGGERPGATFWTTFATEFPFPLGTTRLHRYMAGRLDPTSGDDPCSVPPQVVGSAPEVQRSVCHVKSAAHDTRFMLATGPFELGPGASETIAVAYVVAPAVATLPGGAPSGIVANSSDDSANPPGVPSFHPGFASARGCTDETATDCTTLDSSNPVRPIERAAGWIAYDGPAPATALESPAQKLEPFAVQTATHSLLDRALVAQVIFDSRFLRPTPPEPPPFYVLPGDEAATIVWEPSPTVEAGDPFFALAGDPTSVLYNPNYRQFDVFGYELWRGTSADDLEVIAVYVEDEPYVDRTCETVPPRQDLGLGAGPGYSIGETCPDGFEQELSASAAAFGFNPVFNNGVPGGRPGRGVARSATGTSVFVSDLRPFPRPAWGDRFPRPGPIPYLHRDTALANNFTYLYAVTAIDLNSPASGPPTLRSDMAARSVIPRAEAPNLVDADFEMSIEDGSGQPLPTDGEYPDIHPEDGTFDGPFPPTEGISQSFAPLVPQLLPEMDLAVRIDSVKPDWERQEGCTAGPIDFQSTCWRMYLTSSNGRRREVAGLASNWIDFGRPSLATTTTTASVAEISFDESALHAFGIPSLRASAVATLTLDQSINFSNWEGQQNRRSISSRSIHGGVRWFSGPEETTADPARYTRVGRLSGIDSVWAPVHDTPLGPGQSELPNSAIVQWFGYLLAHLGRTADFEVRWRDGTITVRDVTHGVDVTFSGDYGSSWGFLNDDCDGSGAVDWVDFFCVGEGRPFWEELTFAGTRSFPAASLSSRPRIGPVGLGTNLPQGPTHTGFALYLNGMRHFFATDRLPTDGTVWTLRTYHGEVRTDFDRTDVADPGGYDWHPTYDGGEGIGSPLIPGLTLRWRADRQALGPTGPADLAAIHTVPDPYLLYSAYDGGGPDKQIVFVNLPPRATIRVYSLGGVLVDVVDHDDPTGGGRAPWDLRNRHGQLVASGVYFWHVVTPGGEEKVGKFTIVNPDRE